MDNTDANFTDIMVIPAETAGTEVEFTVTIKDGNGQSKDYTVTSPFTGYMQQGSCYQFTLTLTATGFIINSVVITEWGNPIVVEGDNNLHPQLSGVGVIDLATATNGVYAVAQNGKGLTIENADESCIAVALIQNEHKLMISKENASNNGSNFGLYWNYDYSGLDVGSYSKAYETYDVGHLGNNIPLDFNEWLTGAVSDFSGKANTAVISANSSDEKDMCVVLAAYNENELLNERTGDWYIPAYGQLTLIAMNREAINVMLDAIGGLN